jgi:hypothetical protein
MSQSAEGKNTKGRGIPARLDHSHKTALPLFALTTLPEDHIRTEAGKAFVDGIEDPDIKIRLLQGGEKT